MEVVRFILVCSVLITICVAVENRTTDLMQQLKIQKREKQYLMEDEPSEGPEQKREERQSNPTKDIPGEFKIQGKPMNGRFQPKVTINPGLINPAILQKPLNVNTTPQRLANKMPLMLKTPKLMPVPAHALRLKVLENRRSNIIPNKNTDANKESEAPIKEDLLNTNREENAIPKTIPITNKENKVIAEPESKLPLNNDNSPNKNVDNRDPIISNEIKKPLVADKEEKSVPQSATNLDVNRRRENSETPSEPEQNPAHFFIEEAEAQPQTIKIQPYLDNNSAKIEPANKGDHVTNNQADSEQDIIRISNGTHTISIKKIHNPTKKMQLVATRDDIDEPNPPIKSKIMNQPASTSNGDSNEVLFAGIVYNEDSNSEVKDTKDCITITNHNYEEFEERPTIPPPVITQPILTYNDASQIPWNYLNSYYNPYCYYPQRIYDQYKNYGLLQNQENYQYPCIQECQPNNLNDGTAYNDQRSDLHNGVQSVDNYWAQPPQDNLSKIWRTWKDVEIKIRKKPSDDVPVDIDIRRDLDNGTEVNADSPVQAYPCTQNVGLSGYYNNQNNGFIYPYVNPTYRYMR